MHVENNELKLPVKNSSVRDKPWNKISLFRSKNEADKKKRKQKRRKNKETSLDFCRKSHRKKRRKNRKEIGRERESGAGVSL